jgi:hypothetical protein
MSPFTIVRKERGGNESKHHSKSDLRETGAVTHSPRLANACVFLKPLSDARTGRGLSEPQHIGARSARGHDIVGTNLGCVCPQLDNA